MFQLPVYGRHGVRARIKRQGKQAENNKAGFQDPHPENRLWQKQEGT